MTDKEKAIVMAHTGICMLTGDKFYIFHKYVEELMGRPILTHEIGWLADAIKERSKVDFMALCADESSGQKPKWIPVSERLPENLQTVNVTWQNHEPEPYYHDIKDRSFVATAVYYNEDWYWYSTTCADYLGEYGRNDVDKIDEAIEIIAWMPLPLPYAPSN